MEGVLYRTAEEHGLRSYALQGEGAGWMQIRQAGIVPIMHADRHARTHYATSRCIISVTSEEMSHKRL